MFCSTYIAFRWKAAGLDRMKVVPDTCTLKSKPSQDGSVLVEARFTMRPDPSMKSIIGQTAHNLDEVCFEVQCKLLFQLDTKLYMA